MTRYDKIIKNMTIDKLAELSVDICVLNHNQMFYLTSTGQLFPYNSEGCKAAIEYEKAYLNEEIK